jgi:hypothetical protein
MIYLTTFMVKAVEPSQVVQPRHTPPPPPHRGGGVSGNIRSTVDLTKFIGTNATFTSLYRYLEISHLKLFLLVS